MLERHALAFLCGSMDGSVHIVGLYILYADITVSKKKIKLLKIMAVVTSSP